jgi:uncharacterized protein YbjT (DUF2867 family)
MFAPISVLVTGATGKQGGAVARLLLGKGHKVRALTRKPESPAARELAARGAEMIVGDLTDREVLRRGLEHADAVFAMSTPFESGMAAETLQGITVADAAKEAGVHLVYTSVASAQRNTGIPHFESKWQVEEHIRALGGRYTILRPVYFMENLVTWGLADLQAGRVSMPLRPTTRLQQITLSDIGEFAVQALEQRHRFDQQAIDIASDGITGEQAVRILSRVTGREIAYFEQPIEVVRSFSEDFATMYEWFERVGYDVDTAALRREYPAVQWHTFEAWAEKQDWPALIGSAPQPRPSQRRAAEAAGHLPP